MKILKHGIKGKYFRFSCPKCHCEYVAEISEIEKSSASIGTYDSLLGSSIHITCPECGNIVHTVANEYFYNTHECDENGNLINKRN